MDLIIVTGLSGAGKSTVVRAMEDIGYFCVDNIPVSLIPTLADSLINRDGKKRVAVVSDVRAGLTPGDMQDALSGLEKIKISYKILFIDCKMDALLGRFRLARRAHPLSDECIRTVDAISMERQLMEPFRQMADYVIDTTLLSLNCLKNRVFELFGELEGLSGSAVKVHCVSFGFKHGVPSDADFVFDVRSLPNPYYVEELRSLTGLDERVSRFVTDSPESREFEQKLLDFCDFVVPLTLKDGRSQLVIAIGCTGGHHRSVAFTEILYRHLISLGYVASVTHRDTER